MNPTISEFNRIKRRFISSYRKLLLECIDVYLCMILASGLPALRASRLRLITLRARFERAEVEFLDQLRGTPLYDNMKQQTNWFRRRVRVCINQLNRDIYMLRNNL